MKTPREYADNASKVLGDGFKGISRAELLLPFFIKALDQTLQWREGPPKEEGRYVVDVFLNIQRTTKCEMLGRYTGLQVEFMYGGIFQRIPPARITRHIGPIPDTPENLSEQTLLLDKINDLEKAIEVLKDQYETIRRSQRDSPFPVS